MQFLNPTNDVAFKKIFGSEEHKGVTISFLNSILEFTGTNAIADVTLFNTEHKENALLCTDQLGNRYIIELQVNRVWAQKSEEVCYVTERMAWLRGELNVYEDAIVREADRQGALELAIEEGVIKAAINLLDAGFDIETIMQITDLSAEEIEELKKKK